jgi:hypothetical protein
VRIDGGLVVGIVLAAIGIKYADNDTVAIGLALVAGLLLLFLVARRALHSDRLWKWIADKVKPHLPPPTAVTVQATPIAAGRIETASSAPDGSLAAAVGDLLDEVRTLDGRLQAAILNGWYPYNFDLPSAAYHKHKALLSAHDPEARDHLGGVYVKADSLNRWAQMGEDGVEVGRVGEPVDPEELRQEIAASDRELSQLIS